MDKRIKILVILNCISYALMCMIVYLKVNGTIDNLSNTKKIIIGTAPLVLVICTSFICTNYYYNEFKYIKKEAILDLSVRILAFGVVFYGLSHYVNMNMEFGVLLIAFLFNSIIEYLINKKIVNLEYKTESQDKINVTQEEKDNLRAMMISTNKAMASFLVFCVISLSVPVTKNMEGTTENWFIPVMFSVFGFIWFVKTSRENYNNFYLNKNYAKKIFIRNITFSSIGYSICLGLSFFKFDNQIYGFIEIVGILFLFPTITTMRKMSRRLKEVRDSIGKDKYNYFLVKKDK